LRPRRPKVKTLFLLVLLSQTSVKVPATCGTNRHSVVSVGVTATAIPATPLAARAWVDVCVSVENAGTPVVKCRADGTAPVLGSSQPGDALSVGDCIRYAPPQGTTIQCIASSSTAVSVTECSRTL
jgi:hypothetical protein